MTTAEVRAACEAMDPRLLSPDGRAWWEERAAIREYEGGQSRRDAERGAWADLKRTITPRGIR